MVIGLQKAKVKPKCLSVRECGSNYGIFIQQTLQVDKVSELELCTGKWETKEGGKISCSSGNYDILVSQVGMNTQGSSKELK